MSHIIKTHSYWRIQARPARAAASAEHAPRDFAGLGLLLVLALGALDGGALAAVVLLATLAGGER